MIRINIHCTIIKDGKSVGVLFFENENIKFGTNLETVQSYIVMEFLKSATYSKYICKKRINIMELKLNDDAKITEDNKNILKFKKFGTIDNIEEYIYPLIVYLTDF